MQWIVYRCIEIIHRLYASGHTAFKVHKYRTCQRSKRTISPHKKEDKPPPAVCGEKYGYFNVTRAADVVRKHSTGCFFVFRHFVRCRGPPVRSSIKISDKEVIRYAETK